MAVRINTGVRNAAVDAVRTLPDAGSGAGKLRIYTGAQPATPATAATGTLLVEITLNDPASDTAASAGSAPFDVAPEPSGIAGNTGTAGWARLLDSNNLAIIDASVSESGGGGNLIIDDADIVAGASVSISALTISQPAS